MATGGSPVVHGEKRPVLIRKMDENGGFHKGKRMIKSWMNMDEHGIRCAILMTVRQFIRSSRFQDRPPWFVSIQKRLQTTNAVDDCGRNTCGATRKSIENPDRFRSTILHPWKNDLSNHTILYKILVYFSPFIQTMDVLHVSTAPD